MSSSYNSYFKEKLYGLDLDKLLLDQNNDVVIQHDVDMNYKCLWYNEFKL